MHTKKTENFLILVGAELNHKFGFATKNIPQMLKDLVDLKYIENHTINGFYNRY